MTPDPSWTSSAHVEAALLKLWDQGRFLAATVGGGPVFPFRMRVRGPETSVLGARFGDVQAWIRELEAASRVGRGFGFDLTWREVRHREIGRNRFPSEIIVPDVRDGLRLIGKETEAARFDAIVAATIATFPALVPWLARRPLLALAHVMDWPRILAVLAWFRDHPASGLYLRQVDITEIDTKFIETRRSLLVELLEIALGCGDPPVAGTPLTLEGRYGLRSKPATVRFRLLDGISGFSGLTDISTPAEEFARLDLDVRTVFITENEINGLAFPLVREAIVLFGLGYGLDVLAQAHWLQRPQLLYWGDIDTHGFAMLSRLRSYFSQTQSILMDEATLLTHRASWVREDRPFLGELPRLSEAEHRLFAALKGNNFGDQVRLEQERIAYNHLIAVLQEQGLVAVPNFP
jgi:hypothetical protein